MDKIKNQKHTSEIFYYAISRMFERASYYGFRGVVILYMLSESLKMETKEAYTLYGWLASSIVISKVIGALLGDLLIGNKKSIIIGGIIQAVGAFCLSFGAKTGLYIGLFLIVFGSGLYTSNIISNFGKSYLNKTKLLDSGFTMFYFATNLGAFLGGLFIGYLGESFGYNIGFVISGVLILLSIVPIIFTKENIEGVIEKSKLTIKKRALYILVAFIIVGLFWAMYRIANIRIYDLQTQFSKIATIGISKSMWQSLSSAYLIPLSLFASILWTFVYNSQYLKLMLGYIFGAISFGLLLFIPNISTEQHMAIFLLSILFLGVAEVFIAPIIHSVLTEYSNPKYLAILISLTFIPIRLFSAIILVFNDRFYENPTLGVRIVFFVMVIISITLLSFVLLKKRKNYK